MKKTTPTSILLMFCLAITAVTSTVWATTDSWTTLEPMPTARSSFGVAVVDGKIYAIGGIANSKFTNINEVYDPETNTWTTKTPMPTSRAGFGIAAYQNKIFVFGGSGYIYDSVPEFIETTEVYDPETDTWETKSSIPTPRDNLCASIVNNEIYLIGGNNVGGATWPFLCNNNEAYDPETDTWTTKSSIPNYTNYAISDLTSVVVDNKIYLMSGIISQKKDMNPTDPFNQVYDPETDAWSSAKMMPTLVSGLVAGATSGEFAPKRIHVIAGNTHQIYDPETDNWTTGIPIPTSRNGAGVAVVDDELYVIGGGSPTTFFATNEKYTPAEYIPEFSLWSILALTVAVALVVIIYRKKL